MPGLPSTTHPRIARDVGWPIVLLVVVGTRAITVWNWVAIQHRGYGDVTYYWTRITGLSNAGPEVTLREYPTPVLWLLNLPEALPGGGPDAYAGWFILLVVVTDLAFCLVLWTSGAAFRGWAIITWSLLCVLLGPLHWLRFDLLPAVTVGAAFLLAARRPGLSGAALAIGGAIKLWPALLFPLLLRGPGQRSSWRRPVLGFGIAATLFVAISLVTAGWTRLLSPLAWQSDRGLQIESLPATIPMILRATDPVTWQVHLSPFLAYEIFGPGVAGWGTVAQIVTVTGYALAGLVILRHLTRDYSSRDNWVTGGAVAAFAVVMLLLVTNKTLSPQYLIWLAGPLVALLALHGPGVRPVRRWVLLALAATATTQLVYPTLYDFLNGMINDPVGTPWATAALATRNLLLLGLTIDSVHRALSTRQPGLNSQHRD